MSLYDDFDAVKQKSDHVAGWSSGIKLFQSQLQLKKASQTQPRRDALRKVSNILAPVIDLKSKKDDDDSNSNSSFGSYSKDARSLNYSPHQNSAGPTQDMEWIFDGAEYDPTWPNDYEKVVKELRDLREKEKEKEDDDRRKRRDDRVTRLPRESRFEPGTPDERGKKIMMPMPNMATSFAGTRNESDEEEEEIVERPRGVGVAIAPPPSLQESSPLPASGETLRSPAASGASVAAKIMAKYGFKEGQGLGKKEQGISMALQVEKTSKRGGRIIHEKEIMPPPPAINTPPPVGQPAETKDEPSITEIMRSPSKVVLLRNMVGPGEVDEELEPEVKDECNTKYGDVIKVMIHEQPLAFHEEAVRIFVEFKRIESAIKAVVDLNGRFFGGRQVKAGFYDVEKFYSLKLLE